MSIDVAIIGAGPAGIASCIQLCRCGIKPMLIEKRSIGGALENANLVENYPGFPNGITGKKLAELFRKQLHLYNFNFINEEILSIDYSNVFILKSYSGQYQAKFLINALGTIPLRIPEFEIPGRCFNEISKMPEIINKTIAIIGSGDAAFDYALNLSKTNNNSIILIRNNKTKCLPLLLNRVDKNSHIKYVFNSIVQSIKLNNNYLYVDFIQNGEKSVLKADYLLIAIGREPTQIDFNEGFLSSKKKIKSEGLYYEIGDYCNETYRQTAISCGDGLLAAMKIAEKIKKSEEI